MSTHSRTPPYSPTDLTFLETVSLAAALTELLQKRGLTDYKRIPAGHLTDNPWRYGPITYLWQDERGGAPSYALPMRSQDIDLTTWVYRTRRATVVLEIGWSEEAEVFLWFDSTDPFPLFRFKPQPTDRSKPSMIAGAPMILTEVN